MKEKSIYKSLGVCLKAGRLSKGFSQGDVARRLGYSSPQFVSNFERGLAQPPLKALKKLVDLYDLNRNEVIRIITRQEEQALKHNLKRMLAVL